MPHPVPPDPSAGCHYVSPSSARKEEPPSKCTGSHVLSPGSVKQPFMTIVPAPPAMSSGTVQKIDYYKRTVCLLFLPFPHIKLSLCQMSCHQIWCCKEIAVIFTFPSPLTFGLHSACRDSLEVVQRTRGRYLRGARHARPLAARAGPAAWWGRDCA